MSLWLVISWLKAVTVINGLERNMLVFIYCIANFVTILNANNKYCFTLRTLASDKLDEGYDSHHLIGAEYAGVLPGYSLQWLTGLEDRC